MAGEYREPLVQGLRLQGQESLAEQVANRDIQLAINGSIRGNVERMPHLRGHFMDALYLAKEDGADEFYCDKYIDGLRETDFVVVAAIGLQTDYNYSCGELFFGS